MKIINWNVNSINSRIEHLRNLILEENPDFILLQEIKCEESGFPYGLLSEFKYEIVISENVKFKHYFPQNRISEEFLIDNNINTSRSVVIHAIYRTILYGSNRNIFFSQLAWQLLIVKNLSACIFKIIKSIVSNDALRRKYYQATFFGILSGFVIHRSNFKIFYAYLMKLYGKN